MAWSFEAHHLTESQAKPRVKLRDLIRGNKAEANGRERGPRAKYFSLYCLDRVLQASPSLLRLEWAGLICGFRDWPPTRTGWGQGTDPGLLQVTSVSLQPRCMNCPDPLIWIVYAQSADLATLHLEQCETR